MHQNCNTCLAGQAFKTGWFFGNISRTMAGRSTTADYNLQETEWLRILELNIDNLWAYLLYYYYIC